MADPRTSLFVTRNEFYSAKSEFYITAGAICLVLSGLADREFAERTVLGMIQTLALLGMCVGFMFAGIGYAATARRERLRAADRPLERPGLTGE
jgi:hypothetical protein